MSRTGTPGIHRYTYISQPDYRAHPGSRSIYRMTKYSHIWSSCSNVFTLHKRRGTPSVGEIAIDFWALKISPDSMHQSVVLIPTWWLIKYFCVSRVLPVPSTHRLFEGDHPSYTTRFFKFTQMFPKCLCDTVEIKCTVSDQNT